MQTATSPGPVAKVDGGEETLLRAPVQLRAASMAVPQRVSIVSTSQEYA